MEPDIKRGVAQHVVKSLFIISFFGLLILLSSGDWLWQGGWLYIVLTWVNFILAGVILIPHRPELLARRSAIGMGTQAWDRFLAPLMAWAPLYIGVLSGLVYRFYGADPVPSWLRILALITAMAGSLLLSMSMLHNPFFEPTVRIQTDIGHQVASSGPYQWVRHPGYLGALIYTIPTPLVFGVWWGFAGVGLMVIALVVRTALEDRFLRENLPGYAAYAEKTRNRLLPGVW